MEKSINGKSNLLYILAGFLLLFFSCTKSLQVKNPIIQALKNPDPKIKTVADSLEKFEVQILFTRIERDINNIPFFEDFEFQVNDSNYFYPASTVKFPVAVLALEKLNESKQYDGNTRFYIEGDSVVTTFYEEVRKIFAISDNEAYNRLFEFLGTDYINRKLKEKGLIPARVSHRLSVSDAFNTKTKPLVIYLNDSTVTQTASNYNQAPERLKLNGIIKGRGYLEDDSLIMKPFDFSKKNYLPSRTLHNLMKRIIFPEKFTSDERFNLNSESSAFLLKAMHTVPSEAGYDSNEFYDSYGKFLIYGDQKDPIPDYVKIYNKVGYAYGTLTDCAYINDTKNKIEFLVTATILVNKNGIFNDNIYEYDTIGIPFLAALGRTLYKQEINRR